MSDSGRQALRTAFNIPSGHLGYISVNSENTCMLFEYKMKEGFWRVPLLYTPELKSRKYQWKKERSGKAISKLHKACPSPGHVDCLLAGGLSVLGRVVRQTLKSNSEPGGR